MSYHASSMTARAANPTAKSVVLDNVFDELRAILLRHAGPFSEHEGLVRNKRDYHLKLVKPLIIDGRKKDELWFASIIMQKDSVGFYLTPLSCCDDVKAKLSPALLKHLDGKTCLHMKALTPELKKDVDAALKIAMAAYKKRKWL